MKKLLIASILLLSILNAESWRDKMDNIMQKDFEIVFEPMLKMVYGVEYAQVMSMGLRNLYNQYYNDMDKIETIEDRDNFEAEYQDQRDTFISRHPQQVASIQYKINPYIKNNNIAKYNLPKPIVNQKIGIYTTIRVIFYLIPKRKLRDLNLYLL